MLGITVGVCAYNEEKNISNLLASVVAQQTSFVQVKEILVVSSGSTDDTDKIVRSWSERDPRVCLIRQSSREGKATAINELIQRATGEIVVIANADNILPADSVEKLCLPFQHPEVGMVGGHPVPIDQSQRFLPFVGRFLWELHHKISLKHPKMGELVGFRNVFGNLPQDTAVDEAWLEATIRSKGYDCIYVPGAVCHIQVPGTFSDFVKQRRRIWTGHLDLKQRRGYSPSTMSSVRIIKFMLPSLRLGPKTLVWTAGAILLEAYARLLGTIDYYRKKNPYIWQVSTTTKEVVTRDNRQE